MAWVPAGRSRRELGADTLSPPSCVLTSLFQVSDLIHLQSRIFSPRGSWQRLQVSESGLPIGGEKGWGPALLGLREEGASHLDSVLEGGASGAWTLRFREKDLGAGFPWKEIQTLVYLGKQCVQEMGFQVLGPLAGTAGQARTCSTVL